MLRLIGRRSSAVTAVAAVALTLLAPITQANASQRTAPSATIGLYGVQDPTYDGVFRQSLGLLGLTSVGVGPAPEAITWLLDQQCASGAFEGYRSDLAQPCAPADPVNFTGPDTNSTAMAAMALMSLLGSTGKPAMSPAQRARVVKAASAAVTWLGRQQNRDGGWPWTTGGQSDANSTGLALATLLSQAANEPFPAYTKGVRYLASLTAACAAGAGLAYQAGGAPNGLATAQALVGMSGTLPVSPTKRSARRAPCANTAKAKAASYVNDALGEKGALASSLGDGPDLSATAWALLGLASARVGSLAVAHATTTLKSSARAFATHSGALDAGALGLLLMVAHATKSAPNSFGGVNLVTSLTDIMRRQ